MDGCRPPRLGDAAALRARASSLTTAAPRALPSWCRDRHNYWHKCAGGKWHLWDPLPITHPTPTHRFTSKRDLAKRPQEASREAMSQVREQPREMGEGVHVRRQKRTVRRRPLSPKAQPPRRQRQTNQTSGVVRKLHATCDAPGQTE
jgi:hypothetical protein